MDVTVIVARFCVFVDKQVNKWTPHISVIWNCRWAFDDYTRKALTADVQHGVPTHETATQFKRESHPYYHSLQ